MAVPTETTYSVAAKVAAHESLRDLIDAGSGAGKIAVRDSGDVLLAEVVLDDPCGAVASGNGQLTLSVVVQEDSCPASGTVAYAEITDSDDTVVVALPAIQGSAAVPGYLVVNTLTAVSGTPFNVLSAVIG